MIKICIDKPQNCAVCPFCVYIGLFCGGYRCVLTEEKFFNLDEHTKRDDCPLEEAVECGDCREYDGGKCMMHDCHMGANDYCSFGENV